MFNGNRYFVIVGCEFNDWIDMKWIKDGDVIKLDGSDISIKFKKVSSNLYATVYAFDLILYLFGSFPIKNQKSLKTEIENELFPLIKDKSLDDISFGTDLNLELRDLKSKINSKVRKG